MMPHPLPLLLALWAMVATPAWAGRPLASDDASTADPGTCQIEAWAEHRRGDGAWVLAPACGVAPGLELGADVTRPYRRHSVHAEVGLAVKWVPDSWQLQTPAGALNFGLKAALAQQRLVASGWQASSAGLLLASLQASDSWSLHANLGAARDHAAGQSAGLLNLAVVWAPHDRAQLFAEVLANNRSAVLGGAERAAGGRWWLAKDRLGLDLTAGREAGSGGPTRWTLGMGWYGLSF